ncbi:MAG: glycosyltransferase family 2 protein [Natronohydrobacter sp.]|nr:glycosyltransferase family 2 protein [Natronohydrobacter sp.]
MQMTKGPECPDELRAQAGALALSGPVTLWLEFDLRAQAIVNLDFRNHAQDMIPLHLSLRRDTGRIVANRWCAKGWRREVSFAAPLQRATHVMQLALRRGLGRGWCVELSLDGRPLGTLDALPRPDPQGRLGLRRGFPGLGDIGAVTWPEGLRCLRMLPGSGVGDLHLNARMELILRDARTETVLDCGDDMPARPFIPLQSGAGGCSAALVPGWVWSGRDGTDVMLLARDRTGHVIARRKLTKAHILDLLDQPEVLWQLRHDTVARLQMLEHVHFAHLWPSVPPEARKLLAQEAQRHPKAGFMPPPEVDLPCVARPMRTPAATACDAFHRSRSMPRQPDPVTQLRSLVRSEKLDPDQTRLLGLLLSEWFCLHSDPYALAQALQDLGVQDWTGIRDAWGEIAALPLLWASGDWHACLKTLKSARKSRPDWLVTPALGWLGAALARDMPDLAGNRPDMAQRVAMSLALLELIADLAPAYMSQTGCLRLISGVQELLAASHAMPDWCQPRFVDLALQAYGLNMDFWRRNPARLPASLLPWRAAFAGLHAAAMTGDWQALGRRARPFLSRPIAGSETLRRLALSTPAMVCDETGLPDMHALTGFAAPRQAEEAALRWLAYPRGDATKAALPLDTATPVHRAAVTAMDMATPEVGRPPMSRAQRHMGRLVQTMLGVLRSGAPVSRAQLLESVTAARGLLRPEAGFLGVAALLALAEALARTGYPKAARTCITLVTEAAARQGPERMQAVSAVPLALARFDALCPDPALRTVLDACLPHDPRLQPGPAQDPRAAALRATANPFADTIVALISCHANLASRLPEIQAAWGDRLAEWGIPLIVVTGRSAGQVPGAGPRFDGKHLQLDAPDDYEGLPQKSLALAEWVLEQTGFSRVYKIDDDCFLDVESFFSDPAFLTSPYYGRPLHRAEGEMDRAWHMGRAQNPRGRHELDKSPEPSRYADGGSGYVLNRQALARLCATRRTPHGRALEQMSFMEDKLVGDLLAQSGIEVAGPGYDIAIFRQSAPGLPPLPQYHSGFLPFAGGQIKLAHLDSAGAQSAARDAAGSPWPMPMKVWPCHRPAVLGWAQHGLSLVSPPERLEQAKVAGVAVISVMRNERFVLDHFLAHYRRLGVGAFLIVDNGSDDGTLEHLVAQPDVSVFTTDTPYRQSAYGVMWQEALMAHFRLGRWSLLADADELAFWTLPDAAGLVQADLSQLLRSADFQACEAVRLLMFDLYPKGPLSAAHFRQSPFLEASHVDREPFLKEWQGRGPWSNSKTLTSALRHRLMTEAGMPARANLFVAQKFALLRYHPFMQLSTGLHYIAGAKVAARDLAFAHFKYHAEFHAKARREAARGQHFNNAEEYRNYLALQAEGRDVLYRPGVSVPLAACAHLRRICGLPEAPDFVALRTGIPPVMVRRVPRRQAYPLSVAMPVQSAEIRVS